jgi:hypothetical protein
MGEVVGCRSKNTKPHGQRHYECGYGSGGTSRSARVIRALPIRW